MDGCVKVRVSLLALLSCLRNCVMSKDFIMSVQRENMIYVIIYLFYPSGYVALIVLRTYIRSVENIGFYERRMENAMQCRKSDIHNSFHVQKLDPLTYLLWS
jgi:ribosomal protein S8